MNKNNKTISMIWLDICRENKWSIMKSQHTLVYTKTEYSLEVAGSYKRAIDAEKITPEQFLEEVDLSDHPSARCAMNLQGPLLLSLLAQFLKRSNHSLVKQLVFFSPISHPLNSWEGITDIIRYQQGDTTKEDFKTFMTQYKANICRRGLQNIFLTMDKLNLSKKERKECLYDFCHHHLDIIKDNPYRNFIYDKITQTIPDSSHAFKEFLKVEPLHEDLLSEQFHYKTYHINKSVLMQDYVLHLSMPATMDDYFTIISSGVSYLNKEKNLKRLLCGGISIGGKTKRYDALVLTVEPLAGFEKDNILNFLMKVLEESTKISEDQIYYIKKKIEPSYQAILNHVILDRQLSAKEPMLKVKKI